jgi:hypothetical protein
VHVSDLVRAEARNRFPPIDAAKVLLLLEGVELPFLSGPASDSERVQLALFKLADGSLERFTEELQRARIDWRDVLDTAGLHHSDWRDVLRGWGYGVPEEP